MNFSKELIKWRDRRELTNEQAAEFIGKRIGYTISRRTFEGWIQGRSPGVGIEWLVLFKIGRAKK